MIVGGTTVSNREYNTCMGGERNDLYCSVRGVMYGEGVLLLLLLLLCERIFVSCRLSFVVRIDDKISR